MQHAHVLKISCIWRGLQFCLVVFISTVAFCLSCIFSVLDSFSSNNGPNIQVRKKICILAHGFMSFIPLTLDLFWPHNGVEHSVSGYI